MIDIEAAFVKCDGDFLEWDQVETRLNQRPDLHAFLLLDKLVPRKRDMVTGAEHDEIFLDVEPEELAAVVTEDQVRELVRCGVRLGEHGLCMFV